jgi:hypothetical protein
MEANIEKIKEASAVVQEYADEALKIGKTIVSKNTLATHIISVVESFLAEKKRIIYGGAAINALLPKNIRFYGPDDLPDYDFLTPDALEDCAVLMEKYRIAGFKDVETRLGIHEGTYKIFVNYRAAADITEMPREIYDRLYKKARLRGSLLCAPPDWLRMAAYLELSRPLGDVENRWQKVFYRLQLLNKIYPLRPAACSATEEKTRFPPQKRRRLHSLILQVLTDTRSFFAGAMVEGVYKTLEEHSVETEKILGASLVKYDPRYILITETLDETTNYLSAELKARFPSTEVTIKTFKEVGELMPERREVFFDTRRIATLFPTIACHAFLSLSLHIPYDPTKYLVRVASVDSSITLLYSMWFAGLQNTVGRRILCVIQALIDIEAHMRLENPRESKISLFPFTCLGHQPSLPELKKAHRERVKAKKESIRIYLEKLMEKKQTRKNKPNNK